MITARTGWHSTGGLENPGPTSWQRLVLGLALAATIVLRGTLPVDLSGGPPASASAQFNPSPDRHFFSAVSPGRIIGWVAGVSAADGVISGWAVDTQDPQKTLTITVYSDAPGEKGGTLMGTTPANAVSRYVEYMHALVGSHGFAFPIPAAFKDGRTHAFFVQAGYEDGSLTQSLAGSATSFSLRAIPPTSEVIDASSCMSPSSSCASRAFDYGPPNFPSAAGWSDGHDYFKAWGCSSSAGLAHIVRLNIIPYDGPDGLKYHDNNFQKDSVWVNMADQMYGSPIIYFTASRFNTFSSVFSLKKAAFGPDGNWQIFDMLDYPSSPGGLSSLDGRFPAFIMNDYSQPGWGPTSPYPGRNTSVPGVADVPANPEQNSFPLVGTGSNGLTAIATRLQGPGARDGGVAGRTCIHMNPKLFDYDSRGVPQSMTVYLFQQATTADPAPCSLPDGSTLPRIGYYTYRYQGATGWQLDRAAGPAEAGPNPDQAMKLMSNAGRHMFIAGNWNGQITTVDFDDPSRTRKAILSCSKTVAGAKAKFGEATGSSSQVWFLAIPPGGKTSYGNGVFTGDIYYAYSDAMANSASH
jgi:hypothetical protein